MTQESIDNLISISESDLLIYAKVKGILSEIDTSYICIEPNIMNWYGREIQIGEILTNKEYSNTNHTSRHCYRKTSIQEIIDFYKSK